MPQTHAAPACPDWLPPAASAHPGPERGEPMLHATDTAAGEKQKADLGHMRQVGDQEDGSLALALEAL